MTDEIIAKRVDGEVLGKAGASGRAERRSNGEFLSKVVAGGRAARRCSGGIFDGGRRHNRVGDMH